MSAFKYRKHKRYVYAYIPVSTKNLRKVYREVVAVCSKIGAFLNTDISEAVKIGTREVIIYNQDVV